MAYSVKEIFYTLQGEGIQMGRPAVFCRFSGCNLWSGREEDRAEASCYFCDTDFVGTNGSGGGKFSSAEELSASIKSYWPEGEDKAFVVFTGGEPLLQIDEALLSAVKDKGFEIAVETNGTIRAPEGIDWICVSPKPNSELMQTSGDELKLVYPHEVSPQSLAKLNFKHFLISPLWTADESERKQHIEAAVAYCQENPQWRLTMQCHKIWGIA